MAYNIILNGTNIPAWSSSPPIFNGVICKKVIYNNILTYNYLSMNYTHNSPDRNDGWAGSFVGWRGAKVTITRYSDTKYRAVLSVTDFRSDYQWRGSGSSITQDIAHGTDSSMSIGWESGRDQVSLRATISFNMSNGKVNILVGGRAKSYQSYTTTSSEEFEG